MPKISMKLPRIIVAHPGEQHARRAVVALQSSGMFLEYITSFYYKKTTFVGYLPNRIKHRLEKELCRRRNDKIDDSLVAAIMPIHESCCILATRVGMPEKISRWLRWRRNCRFDEKVTRIIKEKSPDAVIGYDTAALRTLSQCQSCSTVGVLDQTIGHLTAWKKILEEEMALHPQLFKRSSYSLPNQQQLKELKAEALAADWILAGSEYTKNTLIDIGVAPERIKIIPYGADIERFWPAESGRRRRRKKFKVLFVGSIGIRKGVHYLLEAIRQLNHPQIKLILVGGIEGNGKWLSQYEGIFKHVPFVTHDRLCQIYRDSDIFVFPSLHEGSAIVTYEALASGLPVVTTPNSGTVVRDGKDGFIVPIRDVEALMEKIYLLSQDQELKTKMSENARQRAINFTWQAYGQRLIAFVKHIIQTK